MTQKKSFKKIHIDISKEHEKMLEEIQKKQGYYTTAETVRACIHKTYHEQTNN